jgi:hypothetical protein
MITGPLGLRYSKRFIPRMEMGEIAFNDPPTPYRVKRWLDLAPRVGGDIFLKLYTHGAREDNADALLGTATRLGGLPQMFQWLHEACQERQIELHWASAYGMFCAIEALTQGAAGAFSETDKVWQGSHSA